MDITKGRRNVAEGPADQPGSHLENFSVLTPGEKPPCTPGWTNHIQVTRRNRILGSYFCFKNNWDQLNRTEFGYVDVRCWNFCGNGLV